MTQHVEWMSAGSVVTAASPGDRIGLDVVDGYAVVVDSDDIVVIEGTLAEIARFRDQVVEAVQRISITAAATTPWLFHRCDACDETMSGGEWQDRHSPHAPDCHGPICSCSNEVHARCCPCETLGPCDECGAHAPAAAVDASHMPACSLHPTAVAACDLASTGRAVSAVTERGLDAKGVR